MSSYGNQLIVITAPSGAGKSTLIKKLMEEDNNLVFSTSYTTRKPRTGEVDGVDYNFISRETFLQKKMAGEFLESFEVHGNLYGTAKKDIEALIATGKKVILDIDVQGSLFLQKTIDALYIFISVASVDVLRERLVNRGTEDTSVIEHRVKNGEKELAYSHHWKHLLINDNFNTTFAKLKEIIYS